MRIHLGNKTENLFFMSSSSARLACVRVPPMHLSFGSHWCGIVFLNGSHTIPSHDLSFNVANIALKCHLLRSCDQAKRGNVCEQGILLSITKSHFSLYGCFPFCFALSYVIANKLLVELRYNLDSQHMFLLSHSSVALLHLVEPSIAKSKIGDEKIEGANIYIQVV